MGKGLRPGENVGQSLGCTRRLTRQILLSLLLPRQSRLRNEIEEALDMEFLHQQADRGDLNVSYLSKYILNMMVLLCAPVRDEAVQRLENISDPVRLLR